VVGGERKMAELQKLNIPQIDWNEFAEKGRAIYERLKDQLLPQYKGWFIAIDPRQATTLWAKTRWRLIKHCEPDIRVKSST
jgi:hypothetical protein